MSGRPANGAVSGGPAPPVSRPLAVSLGDPAGVGPELCLKAWHRRVEEGLPPFVVFGSLAALLAAPRIATPEAEPISILPVTDLTAVAAIFNHALPVFDVPLAVPARAGLPDVANGPAIVAAIDTATAAVVDGAAAALVTCPIAKSVLYDAGFRHPGHTEYLAELAARLTGQPRRRSVMLLVSDALRVVPLTIHVPLRDVADLVTAALIEETVAILADALRTDFGIAAPRIAIAGLNPHAGEGGAIGREEVDVIAPAIGRLRACGLTVSGPHSADTMFHAIARARYDAAVTMYHDQGLIPIKTLSFDTGVNVTLGLPFVRTSPDHGTAFDIAGQGIASENSFVEALRLAAQMASRRANKAEHAAVTAVAVPGGATMAAKQG